MPRGRAARTGRFLWFGKAFTGLATVSVGAQSFTEVIDASATDDRRASGGTIRRVIGDVTLKAGSNNLDVFWSFYLMVLSDEAVAASAEQFWLRSS